MDFDVDTSFEIPVQRAQSVSYRMPGLGANPDFNPFTRYGDGESESRPPHDGVVSRAASVAGDDAFVKSTASFEQDYMDSVMEYIEGGDASQAQLGLEDAGAGGGVLPLAGRYFAASMGGVLVVVDRHRAWEAVLYDRYMVMLSNETSVTQQLLFPEQLTMSSDDIALLRDNMDEFTAFGFDLSAADEHSVIVAGVPADMTGLGAEDMIYELIDAMREGSADAGTLRRERVAAAMARVGAKAKGHTPGKEELETLMQQLAACSNYSYTPSGLPVMTALTEDEIGKRLK
jgi:DNA mismatch repair protein MutL